MDSRMDLRGMTRKCYRGIIRVSKTMTYKPGEDGKTTESAHQKPPQEFVRFRCLMKWKLLWCERSRIKGRRGNLWWKAIRELYSSIVLTGSIPTPFCTIPSRVLSRRTIREKLMKANLEKRQPVYLPKMSAHIFQHTFCTRMCEQNVSLKVSWGTVISVPRWRSMRRLPAGKSRTPSSSWTGTSKSRNPCAARGFNFLCYKMRRRLFYTKSYITWPSIYKIFVEICVTATA